MALDPKDRTCPECGALCDDPAWFSCHECGAALPAVLRVGSRVKYTDWETAGIQAYRDLIGTVVEVNPRGWVKVQWDADLAVGEGPDFAFRNPATVVEVES